MYLLTNFLLTKFLLTKFLLTKLPGHCGQSAELYPNDGSPMCVPNEHTYVSRHKLSRLEKMRET